MPEENVFNLEERRKKLTEAQRRVRQKEIDDVRKILKTPEGRRDYWRRMGKCGILRSSFTPNSNQTAFNEGKREIGLDILIDINEADCSAFARMQNEYVSALKSKKQAKENA
ncbi:hypothetical protein D4R71_00360 [bacterium]|nr:MAG: hypothetical protein D4R71_00360 [bacterium]